MILGLLLCMLFACLDARLSSTSLVRTYEASTEARFVKMEKRLNEQSMQLEAQSNRIEFLESKVVESENQILKQNSVIDTLKKSFFKNKMDMSQLQKRLGVLNTSQRVCSDRLFLLRNQLLKYETFSSKSNDESDDFENPVSKIRITDVPLQENRERRLLVASGSMAPLANQYSAFYAYLSHHELAPGKHHTLIFDTVKTNTDGAYSGITGVYTVPLDGVYGFIYTIRMGCHTAIALAPFEIMKNNDAEGVAFIDVPCNEQNTVTGNVIIHAVQGDKVFIRTHTQHPVDSNIYSDTNGRTSFAGWLIHADQ
ncbi:unnamed protein product [Mytilus edulis]|uniref:C1q domain-containing protein n=1 Tax=Mytilus edulis TaxID=6550 RepID=A0A8S3PSL2_MYTED|nr:unnamed protein product [Mytilus edulis]